MTVMALPRTVIGTVTDLAACLCAQIAETPGLPDVCFCGVIPGEAASPMYGGDCTKKCGMAWVRLVAANPASGVAVPSETPGNCGAGLGFDVEMGMLRCTPIGDATTGPSAAELLAAAELQYADLQVMRAAVACCPSARDWMLGTYTPMGPGGGLVGGFWTLSMWMP